MRRRKSRLLSGLLVFVMLLSLLPGSVYADTVNPDADKSYSGKTAQVATAETVTTEEITVFAGDGDAVFNTSYFTDEYNVIDVTRGDACIDYAALEQGDVVMNSTFNGIFVTRIPYDADTYETQRGEIAAYISASCYEVTIVKRK